MTSPSNRPKAPQPVELQVPAELVEPLAALFPKLVANGARRVEVFSYGRPGESSFWLAFLITDKGRDTAGTADLRHLRLEEQVPELLEQLSNWPPSSLGAPADEAF